MHETLNPAQRAAVTAADGPVVIIAGPGTGKTKTLTARVQHLLATKQATPQQILALTFTKKAAEEMRTRVGPAGKRADILTFHALCHDVLGGEFSFISEAARLQLIKQLPRPASLKGLSVREVALRISRAKNMADDDPDVRRLTRAYTHALEASELADFDDLLTRTKTLLESDPTARAAIQSRYTHILVDEFQDTNLLQYELLKSLRGNDNVFVIGDPEQSIYGFRGASGDIFAQFAADFPKHTAVTLTTNYRSAPEIVRLSNSIASAAPDLEPNDHAGTGIVQAVCVLNEYSEAAWVVREIQRAIGGGDMLAAVSDDDARVHRSLRDFAVVYRSRSAAVTVQKAMEQSGLPYQVAGDGSPYDTPVLQSLIALMRASITQGTPPLEGFSAAEQRALRDLLGDAKHAVPKVLGEKLVRMLGLQQEPGVQQFLQTLVGYTDIQTAIAYFDAIAEQGFYDPQADAVTLLTIHASKGLEFPYVFLVGAEEGLLPHARADQAEERRLFYVAATRAKERLDIMYTHSRGGQPATASRFVRDVPDAVLPKRTDPRFAADQQRVRLKVIKKSQQSLF
ncbi:MAG TPA: ATP-dependent helicase [Candidatus Saccharimonadales bacterium]|nr:ATP-dependent helicase [Candidatus Saccharimonadales bacterium]